MNPVKIKKFMDVRIVFKKFKCEDHYLNHERNCNNEEFTATFIQINQVVEGPAGPSPPVVDMNSTSIRQQANY